MKRLMALLVITMMVLGVGVAPAAAHDSDDDRRPDDSDLRADDDDDRRGDDDNDDDDDDDDDDDRYDDDDDDDDRNRNRNRNRNRGGGGAAPSAGAGTTSAPAGPPADAASVTVNDRSFAPQTVNIAVGGTVTWDNVSREHTVTADDRSFDSGVFDEGQQFSQTFDATGSVDYLCLIHPEMTGTVIVGDAPGASSGPSGQGSAEAGPSGQGSASSSSGPPATRSGSSGSASLGGSAPPPLAAGAAGTVDVDVVDFAFAPDEVTVAPGTTVRWTMSGQAPHTVTAADFDSGMLQAGQEFEHTFNEEGTVEYRCDLHPEMTGTIAVVQGAPPPETDGAATTGDGQPDGTGSSRGSVPASALANTGGGLLAAVLALLVLATGGAAVAMSSRRKARATRDA